MGKRRKVDDVEVPPLSPDATVLAETLRRLFRQILEGWIPNHDRPTERDGLTLVRAGLAMLFDGDRAERLADDWAARGFPHATIGEGASGGPAFIVRDEITGLEERVPATSTELAGEAGADEWERRAVTMLVTRRQLVDSAISYRNDVALAVAVARNTGRPEPTGSGHCEVCGKYCTGADGDRLRGGYCPRDHRAWLRAGRPDRFQFKRSRTAAPEAASA